MGMLRKVLYSKLHMCTVTAVEPAYSGSLGVDRDILIAAGLRSHDAILVANCRTGERFETYVIPLERGSRRIEVNGAAARLAKAGDRLIVLHFATLSDAEYVEHRPRVLIMNADNTIERTLRYDPA
jgi:aspartate 1-decarboxylase